MVWIVIDECHTLLEYDNPKILTELLQSGKYQIILISATISKELYNLLAAYDYKIIDLYPFIEYRNEKITQRFVSYTSIKEQLIPYIENAHEAGKTDYIFVNNKRDLQSIGKALEARGYKVFNFFTNNADNDKDKDNCKEYISILNEKINPYDFVLVTSKGITGNNNLNENDGIIYILFERYTAKGIENTQFMNRIRDRDKEIVFCMSGTLSEKEIKALETLLLIAKYVNTTEYFLKYKTDTKDTKTNLYFELLYYFNLLNHQFSNVSIATNIKNFR
jgi:hypothetical protein